MAWLKNYNNGNPEPIPSTLLKYTSDEDDERSVYDAVSNLYEASDTYSNVDGYVALWFGCIAGRSILSLVVTTPKSMAEVTPSLTYFAMGVRCPNGLIEDSADNTAWDLSNYTVNLYKLDDHHIRVDITKASPFTNVVANTPVTAKGRFTITFS